MTKAPAMTITQQTRTKIFIFYWLPIIIYCLAIYIQSSFPATESLPRFFQADKLAHAGAYALLGFLFLRAFQTTRISRGALLLVILSGLASTAYGISDEVHQYFVPSRTFSPADMLANTVGSFMGAGAAHIILIRKKQIHTG
jgi:VanZ family protein